MIKQIQYCMLNHTELEQLEVWDDLMILSN